MEQKMQMISAMPTSRNVMEFNHAVERFDRLTNYGYDEVGNGFTLAILARVLRLDNELAEELARTSLALMIEEKEAATANN